ncbi:hypothetical protein AAVH_22736 [Aphelenchoides avenae]|nr:hypothetical protein AAVH_22736 [Aphelenchus avenae]
MQSPKQAESPDGAILKNLFPDGGPAPAKRARNGDIDDTWKVLTYRYSLNLSQCKLCRDAFYKNRAASIQKRADGGTRVTLDFCKECTEGNIRMAASYYASFADKKQPSNTTTNA